MVLATGPTELQSVQKMTKRKSRRRRASAASQKSTQPPALGPTLCEQMLEHPSLSFGFDELYLSPAEQVHDSIVCRLNGLRLAKVAASSTGDQDLVREVQKKLAADFAWMRHVHRATGYPDLSLEGIKNVASRLGGYRTEDIERELRKPRMQAENWIIGLGRLRAAMEDPAPEVSEDELLFMMDNAAYPPSKPTSQSDGGDVDPGPGGWSEPDSPQRLAKSFRWTSRHLMKKRRDGEIRMLRITKRRYRVSNDDLKKFGFAVE